MKATSFDIVYQPCLPLCWLVYANWNEDRWLVGAHFSRVRAEEKIEEEYRNLTRPAGILG